MWAVMAIAGSMFSVVFLIHTYFVVYVSKQAFRRGYSFWQWTITGLFSNSIMFVIMLGLLPDRSLERRRLEKKQLLQGKLRLRRAVASEQPLRGAMLSTSVGDMATMDPERMGIQQSIGDQATCVPSPNILDRSIADAATQVHPWQQSIADQETNLGE